MIARQLHGDGAEPPAPSALAHVQDQVADQAEDVVGERDVRRSPLMLVEALVLRIEQRARTNRLRYLV